MLKFAAPLQSLKHGARAKLLVYEDHMIPVHSGTFPKIGDCVGRAEHSGLFEVVDVNTLMQTANLKATDRQGRVIRYPDKRSCYR